MSDSGEVSGNGQGRLREVAALFLQLGLTAFGGPAAHIAMMREEVVRRRRWLTDEQFLDLLGATNLIPGPNSTEMAIFLGKLRAGWAGLLVAGSTFIIPAMIMVLALAWAYVQYGATPQATGLLYGVKPVIVAVVVQALWGLLRTAIKTPLLAAVGTAVVGLYLLGANEIGLMFGAGLLVMILMNWRRLRRQGPPVGAGMILLGGAGQPVSPWREPPAVQLGASLAPGGPMAIVGAAAQSLGQVASSAAVPFSQGLLFLTFVKIGSVLYGSGYVLLAFLRNDFVERLGWLTNQQLLDAVAIGQFTPGPVFTTATFIGYLVGGVPGALLATLGIFLPAFVFVAAIHPWVPRLRHSPWMGAFLDGVNVAAVGLMAAVAWELGRSAIVDPLTAVLGLAAAVLLIRYRINSAWLVAAGGAVGLAAEMVGAASATGGLSG